MSKTAPLRLLAQDAEDLAVLSAALQDAVARIGDIHWDAQARTLTLACNRFRWESGGKTGERVRSALQLGDVTGVQARNLKRDAKGAIVELLAVAFEPGEAPGGFALIDMQDELSEAFDGRRIDLAFPSVLHNAYRRHAIEPQLQSQPPLFQQ